MRLVACPSCHAHYDATRLTGGTFSCACGTEVDASPRTSVDAAVHRCGSCGAPVGSKATACGYCSAEIVRGGRGDLLCPECYAANDSGGQFCTACGVEFRPQPLPETLAELKCVDCAAPLEPRTVGGVIVRECPKCAGLWADEQVFDQLIARAIERKRGADRGEGASAAPRATGGNPVRRDVKYRRCPVCDELMGRRNFQRVSGVIVDQCAHGTWLDPDELEEIAGFILSGGLERAAESERRDRDRALPGLGPDKASANFTRILMENRSAGPTREERAIRSWLDLLRRVVE